MELMFFLLCTFEREDLKKLHDVLAKISKYFRNTICILDFKKMSRLKVENTLTNCLKL